MVKPVKRYLRIYLMLAKYSIMMETEYRLGFLLEIFVEAAYIAVGLISIKVLFFNITEIAGWGINRILVLYGANVIFSEILLGTAFIFNLKSLPHKIKRGELDIILAKPLNSQFALTLWRPYFALIPSLIPGFALIYVGFKSGGFVLNPLLIVPSLIILTSGIVIAYSIGVLVTSLSFWMINASPLPPLASGLVLRFSDRPFSIFTGFWRIVFMFALPVAFMTSFPAQTLLGDFNWWWVPTSVFLATVFLKASNVFWNFALKRYTSAGG